MSSLATRDDTGILRTAPGDVELVDRRTRHAKLFRQAMGERSRVGASVTPIHYRLDPFDEAEPLKEIDLTVAATPGMEWDAACETNGYQVRLWNSRPIGGRTIRYAVQFRRAGRWFAMAPVALLWMNDAGERQLIARPVQVTPQIGNDRYRVAWPGAFGEGLDFGYNLAPDHFRKVLVIRDAAGLPRPTIGTAGLRLVLVMALAWDSQAQAANAFAAAQVTDLSDDLSALDSPDERLAEPAEFAYRDALARELWWLRRPIAWDSAEEPRFASMSWELRRKGGCVLALLAIPAQALKQASFPVYLDVAISEEQIAAATDDAHDYGSTHPGGTTYTDSSNDIRMGASTALFYCAGLRFQTIPIPVGATIDSAAISVCAYGTESNSLDVYVAAEDVDDGATWSSSHKPTNAYASRTTANARWTDASSWSGLSWHDSPDLAAVVAEVVARVGWASNNDLNFIIYNVATSLPGSNMYKRFRSYDYQPSNSAKFNCSYTPPSTFDALLLAGD